MPPLIDGLRVDDVNNPRGYFEWEKIKQLPEDSACIAEAEGKAVKVISNLSTVFRPATNTASS